MTKTHFALLVALCAALLILPGLGKGSLSNYDEACYAEISKNVAAGHIWTLHYNGGAWFEKPPLYFWCSGAMMWLFGPSEWTARAPSAICGILLAVMVFLIGWELIGRLGAIFAALVLATSPDFLNLSRNGMTDTMVIFFCTLAVYCYIRGRARPGYYKGFWISIALALMTKYVVALIPLLAIIPMRWLPWKDAGDSRVPLAPPAAIPTRGIMLGALIGLTWFISLAITNWDAFSWSYWFFNTQTRLMEGMTGAVSADYWRYHLGYHNPGHAYAFLSAIAVVAFLADAIRRREGFPWLMLSWLGVIAFVLFMTRTQLAWYLALGYPVLALIIGYVASRFAEATCDPLAIVAMGWGAMAASYADLKGALSYVPFLTPEVALFGAVCLMLAPTLRARESSARWALTLRLCLLCAILIFPVRRPGLGDYSPDEKEISVAANQQVPRDSALIAYRTIQHPIAFYTDHDVIYYNDRDSLEKALTPQQLRAAYVISTQAGAIELGKYELLAEAGNYRLLHGARIGDVTAMDLEIGVEPEVFYVLFSNGDIEERRSGFSKVLHSTDCKAVSFAQVNGGKGFLVFDQNSVVHAAGDAQAIAGQYIFDGSPPLEIEALPDGSGYYLMSHRGTIQNYGAAPDVGTGLPWPPFRAMAFEPVKDGHLILYENGLIYPTGKAKAPKGVTGAIWNWAVGQDLEKDPAGPGYYACDQFGVIHYVGGKPNPKTPYYNPEKGHIKDFEVAQDGTLCILDDKGIIYRGQP